MLLGNISKTGRAHLHNRSGEPEAFVQFIGGHYFHPSSKKNAVVFTTVCTTCGMLCLLIFHLTVFIINFVL